MMRFASIQCSKMRLRTALGELTALSRPHVGRCRVGGGWAMATQNFGWVGHNAFGPANNWHVFIR